MNNRSGRRQCDETLPVTARVTQQNLIDQLIETNKEMYRHSDDEEDQYPFTPPPARERLNYTRYQLELLRVIYDRVRYPNSVQKQVIAKRVGITRDQVKIWFQNRRRKDVLAKQKPTNDDSTRQADSTTLDLDSTLVPKLVLNSIINEIVKYNNVDTSSKKRRCKRKLDVNPSNEVAEVVCKNAKMLKTDYDMVNPPNRVTPMAFNGVAMNRVSDLSTSVVKNESVDGEHRQGYMRCRGSTFSNDVNNSSYLQTMSKSVDEHVQGLAQFQVRRRFSLESPPPYTGNVESTYRSYGIHNNSSPNQYPLCDSSPDSTVSSFGSCSSIDSIPVLSDLLQNSLDSLSPDSADSFFSPITKTSYNRELINNSRYPYRMIVEPPVRLSTLQQSHYFTPYNQTYYHYESPVEITAIPNPYYNMYHRLSADENIWNRNNYDIGSREYAQL